MNRSRQLVELFVALLLLGAVIVGSGCGDDDILIPGNFPTFTPNITATPDCESSGEECESNSDCCSGSCISPDGINLECQ